MEKILIFAIALLALFVIEPDGSISNFWLACHTTDLSEVPDGLIWLVGPPNW